jgi:hypothetical protein
VEVAMTALSAVGWAGSALLVFSLLQTRVLRFRVLNLVASLILVGFNASIRVWPMVAMNGVIAVINVWQIRRLAGGRRDDHRYAVLPIGPDEPYLRRVLDLHAGDILRFNPGLDLARPWPADPADRMSFLVLDGAETVGLVLAHRVGERTVQVDLDYVLPRYRDFTPGEYVYRGAGPFVAQGISRVVAPPGMLRADRYLASLGFRPQDGSLVLDLAGR